MSDATLLAGHRYIVGRKEYVVILLPSGEKRLGRVIGWADRIGRPCVANVAHYVVAECGQREEGQTTLLLEIPMVPARSSK